MTTPSIPRNTIMSLKPAIHEVWAYVGFDAEEACNGDNECAIETCIDAGRFLEIMRDKTAAVKAEVTIRTLIECFGYSKVLTSLSRAIPLV